MIYLQESYNKIWWNVRPEILTALKRWERKVDKLCSLVLLLKTAHCKLSLDNLCISNLHFTRTKHHKQIIGGVWTAAVWYLSNHRLIFLRPLLPYFPAPSSSSMDIIQLIIKTNFVHKWKKGLISMTIYAFIFTYYEVYQVFWKAKAFKDRN